MRPETTKTLLSKFTSNKSGCYAEATKALFAGTPSASPLRKGTFTTSPFIDEWDPESSVLLILTSGTSTQTGLLMNSDTGNVGSKFAKPFKTWPPWTYIRFKPAAYPLHQSSPLALR